MTYQHLLYPSLISCLVFQLVFLTFLPNMQCLLFHSARVPAISFTSMSPLNHYPLFKDFKILLLPLYSQENGEGGDGGVGNDN